MSASFDPYYKWLGIQPKDQPPHHYRLLGIEVFESDREVIDAAANRVMGYLKELAAGDESGLSQKLLNEISQARLCLLNVQRRREYDELLRAKIAESHTAPIPPAKRPPPKAKHAAPPPPSMLATPPPPASAPPKLSSRKSVPPALPAVETHGSPRHRAGHGATRNVDPNFSHAIASQSSSSNPEMAISVDTEPPVSGQVQIPPTQPRVAVNGKIIAVFLLGLIAAVVGVILVVVGSNREDDDIVQPVIDRSVTDPADNPFIAPSILTLELSDEDRGAVTELLIDQEPQDLPPKKTYHLSEGYHSIVIRRGIEKDSRAFMLTEGQEASFRPNWRLPRKTPESVDLPALDPSFQSTPSSTLP